MTTVDATRLSARLGAMAGALALAAAILSPQASQAQTSTLTDAQRREEIFKDSSAGANDRTQSLNATTNRQQQLLGYQLRKANRTNRQATCRANGLPDDC